MEFHTNYCRRCGRAMAVLDTLMEGYDLICTRCGIRQMINRTVAEPPPCYQ